MEKRFDDMRKVVVMSMLMPGSLMVHFGRDGENYISQRKLGIKQPIKNDFRRDDLRVAIHSSSIQASIYLPTS